MRSSHIQFADLSSHEKITLLSKEFDRIDINNDAALDFSELCRALDEMVTNLTPIPNASPPLLERRQRIRPRHRQATLRGNGQESRRLNQQKRVY